MSRTRRPVEPRNPRYVPPRVPVQPEGRASVQRPSVIVKLDDAVRIQDWDNVENELEALGVLPWSTLRIRFDSIRLRRLYSAVTPSQMEDLVARAMTMDPTYRPPNFLSYFVVEGISAADPETLATTLR